MDLFGELDQVMGQIAGAKPVPFSASAMINKKEILQRLERIRTLAPDELREARSMMRERTEVLAKAQGEADAIRAGARDERDRMVARTEIVNAASREAEKIIEEARGKAREIRMEAEEYVDAKLANFEVVLQKTLAAVAKGRESLRGRFEVHGAEPADEKPEQPPEPPPVAAPAPQTRPRRI
ncbi:MAG: hypothetical protein ACRDJ4_09330 [Actinomycetota bacterium]